MDGTIFVCAMGMPNSYPVFCGGIICNTDTTILDTNNPKSFYASLYENAIMETEFLFNTPRALKIIFPGKENIINNYEIGEKVEMDYNEASRLFVRHLFMRLENGKIVNLHFHRAKGLFLAVYDEDLRLHFTTSDDASKEELPDLDCTLIPLAIYECWESTHQFITKNGTKVAELSEILEYKQDEN